MRSAFHLRALALLGVLAACATPTRTAPPPAPESWLASSDANRRLAVQMAKLRFDALAAADSLPGARLMAINGEVSVGEQRFTGPYAVQLALVELLRGATPNGFLLNPEAMKLCKDGAYEYGGTFRATARARPGEEARAVDGHYEARWVEEDGLPRVIRMRLAPGAGSRALHSRGEMANCENAYRDRFVNHRWQLRISPAFALARGHTIISEWDAALESHGYFHQRTRTSGPWHKVHYSLLQLEGGLRWRASGPFTIELQSTLLPEHARATGINVAKGSHLGLEVRRMRTGLLVGVDRRSLHVAAGAQRLTGEVRARQLGFDGFMTTGTADSITTSLRGLGWIVQSGYSFPASPNIAFEIFGQVYTAPMSVPGHGTVPAIRSDRPVVRGALAVQIAR